MLHTASDGEIDVASLADGGTCLVDTVCNQCISVSQLTVAIIAMLSVEARLLGLNEGNAASPGELVAAQQVVVKVGRTVSCAKEGAALALLCVIVTLCAIGSVSARLIHEDFLQCHSEHTHQHQCRGQDKPV